MKEFKYVITDEVGIHARPAGLLVKKAKEFTSTIIISKDDKSAKATALMKLMEFDISKIKAAGHPDTVVVLLTNSDDYEDVTFG